MNEGGSLYIGAFGTKIREKKTVSLINAKSSEIFNKKSTQNMTKFKNPREL